MEQKLLRNADKKNCKQSEHTVDLNPDLPRLRTRRSGTSRQTTKQAPNPNPIDTRVVAIGKTMVKEDHTINVFRNDVLSPRFGETPLCTTAFLEMVNEYRKYRAPKERSSQEDASDLENNGTNSLAFTGYTTSYGGTWFPLAAEQSLVRMPEHMFILPD